MSGAIDCDICVIGGGSGGLVVAAGAAQMGARTVLIERAQMGGDCLNHGCVPSKALIAAAHAADAMRRADRFGIRAVEPEVDFARTMDHVQGVIAAIAPNDSVERFEGLGVKVLRESARFVGPDAVEAGRTTVRARRFVVATGSRPVAPPIPGLAETPYLTNETVFANRELPRRLVVVGGGPIGLEMAQAHRRLGAEVLVLEAAAALSKDDPELAAVVKARLAREGVDLREGAKIVRIAPDGGGVAVVLSGKDGDTTERGSHLLVAAGRAPAVEGLGLAEAGIAFGRRGIEVDDSLRTTNRRVFAIGDVNGLYPFTHMAGHQASLVLRRALWRLPARLDHATVPWATYTDPELAQAGLTEAQARAKFGADVSVARWDLRENDRAQTERETEGLIKVVLGRRGRILGAGIVAPRAGELIHPWCLALSQRLRIGAMAGMLPPYPTLGEIGKRAAGSTFTNLIFSERAKRIVRLLSKLP